MTGKRKSVLIRKADATHKANVKDVIKRGLLQGNARLQFLQQPAVKKEMLDYYKKNYGKLIKQKI